MMIEDGTGTGRKAKVNLENLLEVVSVGVDYVRHINVTHNKVWTISLDAVAPSGATWFAYFYNGGSKIYVFTRIATASTVAGVFRIAKVTGTAAGGTAIVPSPLNLTSAALMDICTIQSGASITGLTEANLIIPAYIPANQPVNIESAPGIVLPPGAGIAIKAPGALTVNGFIEVYEDESDL